MGAYIVPNKSPSVSTKAGPSIPRPEKVEKYQEKRGYKTIYSNKEIKSNEDKRK